MGKKRKPELDTEQLAAERTLYSSFVSAANAVSQLYTQGVQQQRTATAGASRATLEKVLHFVLRENSGSEHISKAALIHFLQQEYENADLQEASTPQMMMPFGPVAAAAAGSDDQQKANRQMAANMAASPAGVAGPRNRMMGIDEQQQQQQQHQQQQQQHPHQPQQLCHPQQHAGADAMQMQMMNMAASPFTGHMPGMQAQQPNMFMPPSEGAMQ